MAGISSQGATFTFRGNRYTVTSVSVDPGQAEVVDMTGMFSDANARILVPTGAVTGGSVTVDYLTTTLPTDDIGSVGSLVFGTSGFNYTKRAILESATVDARTGDAIRGTMRFRVTDWPTDSAGGIA